MKLQICLFALMLTYAVVSSTPIQKEGRNIVDVPANCPEGTHKGPDGTCVDSWGRRADK